MSNFEDIKAMRKKFGLNNPTKSFNITEKNKEWFDFRRTLLIEEVEEFTDAYVKNDIEEVFDALLDITVISMGTAAGLGLNWTAGWDEVMRSNMQKVRSENPSESKRKNSLDLIKPDGWTPPQLYDLLYQEQKTNFYEMAEHLAKRKAQDYQHSVDRSEYFPFGLLSYVQMIHIKSTRLRSLVDSKEPTFESIEDTCLDMINYCNFMLEHIYEKGVN